MKTPKRSSNSLPRSASDEQVAWARAKSHWIRATRKGIKRDGVRIVFESCEDRWNRDEWFREEMLKEKNTVRTMQHWDTLIRHLGSEEDQYLILKAERQRRFRDKVVIRNARECDRHPSRDNWTSDWVSKSRTGGIAISESSNLRHQALDGGATVCVGNVEVSEDAIFYIIFSVHLGACRA